ncbi:sugar ABC transporter ATP-binding protein [Planctomicrobium piriforme]|uniref:Ribose transport system ATP-binding protein/rhamnose transport system ATP-binding protein n=1 Tax=Planctomicrobium piriforme TaxID=1576369 RepID=A0A1I3KRD0_9PLAN|nr:sugar ABC transporter ATP-binding protein [Planctomicrobium piriforme]SFI74944.1 ribose transport system ATP-binding protein/rhamnose transport system ATP-binding protein [Planctomicrobium piriforme]
MPDAVTTADASSPLLRMQGISKRFPGVRALHEAHLELRAGEVLALLGENGAGKSTLIKMLAGVHQPDEGSIEVHGSPLSISGPMVARQAGIAVIHQEFNLIPALSARENLFLGQERTRLGWLAAGHERREASRLFQRLGMQIDPDRAVRDLTVAQQQVIEIARALSFNARIIVMDEPTAALSPREVEGLFKSIRELRSQGYGIIYVSHRLDEIFEVCDRATFLRDGQYIATKNVSELTREKMIELMVGRSLDQEFPKRKSQRGATRLAVRGLTRKPTVRDVSFELRRGEVLGLTGLIGAGRTEVARLLFGADRADAGSVTLDGKAVDLRSPRQAIASGVCLLTEDRKSQGLVLNRSILENFSLPNLKRFAPWGWIQQRAERKAFQEFVGQMRIKISGPAQLAKQLSGGNQQKIVLAKWLQRNADVIIFDEPTRGIDVGAKFEIYQLINNLAEAGKAILMISSELPEVLGMADRILVMHGGRITGEIPRAAEATQEQIMELAVR